MPGLVQDGRCRESSSERFTILQPRDNGRLNQGDSNRGDEKCQILKVDLTGSHDSVNVNYNNAAEEPEKMRTKRHPSDLAK